MHIYTILFEYLAENTQMVCSPTHGGVCSIDD
jgi:hypothetical protein